MYSTLLPGFKKKSLSDEIINIFLVGPHIFLNFLQYGINGVKFRTERDLSLTFQDSVL